MRIRHLLYKLQHSYIFLTLASLFWLILRTGEKPSRIAYPCQRAALTQISSSFFLFPFLGIVKTNEGFKFNVFNSNKPNKNLGIFISILLLVVILTKVPIEMDADRAFEIRYGKQIETHQPHGPLGLGVTGNDNIFLKNTSAAPLYRVVSVHDSDASNYNHSTGMHWQYVDQTVVDNMFAVGMMQLTGAATLADAWRDVIPYQPGDQVAIKFNFNNAADCGGGNDNVLDGLSETANAIITGLTAMGVPPENIWMYDATRRVVPTRFIQGVDNPNVKFFGASPDGACAPNYYFTGFVAVDSPAVSRFSCTGGTLATDVIRPAQILVDAEHLINVPIFRSHGGMASFTLKNHYGSVAYGSNDQHTLHAYFDPMDPLGNNNYGCDLNTQNILADISNNPTIRDKTRLIIGEGIFGNSWENISPPITYTSFNNDDPNIYFFGRNTIAVSSVLADSLNYERSVSPIPQAHWPNPVEHHQQLHAGAYLGLGVHEHWNNSTDRQYSVIDYQRIDLDLVPTPTPMPTPTPTPTPTPDTTPPSVPIGVVIQ